MKNNSLVTVKNNREGRRLIALLRKHLNDTPKGIKLYARGHRHGNELYHQNLPHRLAQGFAVYLYDKPKTRMARRLVTETVDLPTTRTVEKWVSVPTKWADKPVTPAPAFGHPDL
jgi:hypothetical protein